jgi:CheY-like chemotaxis protein
MVELKNRELGLAQASLEEKAEQLTVTSRYKSEFLANMSHELRTPLNSLLLLSELLGENKEQNLTNRQIEYVQTIHSSADDLLSLINEILDLSKIEAGRMEIDVTAFPPAEIRAYVECAFRQLAEQKGLNFQIEVVKDSPRMIRTDRHRLEQILRNLLSNAFKFTGKGNVTLQVSSPEPSIQFESQTLRCSDQLIAFSVKDTGIGIPKDKQKIIWEAFEQVDATAGRRFGGTGLGLTISREIARLLGGEIHLVSEEGIGSTFTLYLPTRYVPVSVAIPACFDASGATLQEAGSAVADVSPEWAPVDASYVAADLDHAAGADVPMMYEIHEAASALAGKKVLIVDDDIRNVFALTSILESHGIEVKFAKNGKDGIATLEAAPDIDLVLMDIMMPEMDGYETIRSIRSNDRYRRLPIVALTAKAMKGDREKCFEAGATDYISKPVDVIRLISVMKRWLVA